jgi:hypothetical protein
MTIRIVTLSFLLMIASCSRTPDNLQRVMEYQEHKNQQDLDAALEMFADDASLHFGPLGSLQGREQIRGIQEYDLALNTQLQFDNCRDAKQLVSCRTTETNDWLRLADIESITYEESLFTFTSDGRIQSIAATLSPESGEMLGAAIVQFDAWARSNHPDEYAALFSQDGNFSYSYENGERVLGLLRQWHPEQGAESLLH